jgi:hypothetical protein
MKCKGLFVPRMLTPFNKNRSCYDCYYCVYGHYPSSCFYLKRRFGDWILSPSSLYTIQFSIHRIRSHFTIDGQSVCLGVGHPFGAHDQISLFPFFCRKIAWLFVLGRPLWREDWSVICSAICPWSESRRTHNHTLLSHLTPLGSLSVASYDSQGLRWKYSTLSDERTGL